MAYRALVETLLQEGKNRAREITEKAGSEAQAILREAEERVKKLEQSEHEEFQIRLGSERTKILNRAQLEARHLILKAKHDVLEDIFTAAQEELANWLAGADQKRRRRFWTDLVEESMAGFSKAEMKAWVHTEADDDLQDTLRERGIAFERASDPELWLGLRLASAQAEIVMTNSYRSRLRKIKPDLLVDLNTLLFKD